MAEHHSDCGNAPEVSPEWLTQADPWTMGFVLINEHYACRFQGFLELPDCLGRSPNFAAARLHSLQRGEPDRRALRQLRLAQTQ